MRLTRKQFLTSLAATCIAGCDDRSLADPLQAELDRLTNDELIEGLAANSWFFALGARGPDFVKTYPSYEEKREDRPVIRCYDELIRRGASAFAALVEHLKDTAETCAYIESDGPRQHTRLTKISQLCVRALLGEVRPWPSFLYDFHYRPEGVHGSDWSAVPWVSDRVAAWYDERKDYTLFRFQTECVQKTIGLIEGTQSFYGGSGKQKEYLFGLRWCAEYLDKTRTAIPVHATWYYCSGKGLATGIIYPDLAVNSAIEDSIGKPPFEVYDGKAFAGERSLYK